jgi:hypothetical protein
MILGEDLQDATSLAPGGEETMLVTTITSRLPR